jgi:hypothetical protein
MVERTDIERRANQPAAANPCSRIGFMLKVIGAVSLARTVSPETQSAP